MDIFFNDPNDKPLPPEDVHIRKLDAKLWPDGKRVAVRFALSPFINRPNIELKIISTNGEELAELNVVEVLDTEMEFTMHLRKENEEGSHKLVMRVFYSNLNDFEARKDEAKSSVEILREMDLTSDVSEVTIQPE